MPRVRKRRGKPPSSFALARFWWVGLVAAALLVGVVSFLLRPKTGGQRQLSGYVPAAAELRDQYAKYYGRPLDRPELLEQWAQANGLAAKRDYAGAAGVLEGIAKAAAVPAVFNNLGVLYAELNDRARCINAFREALARDSAYRPARENLDRLRGFTADSAAPVTREVEPNDTNSSANVVALDTAVEGSIAGGQGDTDCYVVSVPPPPRDLLEIEITSRSKELIPSIRIFDANLQLTRHGRSAAGAGQPISMRLALEPNTTIYLQVLGVQQTSGDYSLRVKPARAFDRYEPNDDIFTARPIEVGQPVEANLMDSLDTDFYSFRAPRTGTVEIDIRNRSETLVPALTTFTPDKRNSGFGPAVRTPGANLHHTISVEEQQNYYLQVWGPADSSGAYTLTVK